MTDQTPAQELRAAAQALTDAANATTYEIRHGYYWQGLPAGEAWQRGITSAVGGPAGDFCALMSPAVAKALACWLNVTAEGYLTGEDEPGCPNCSEGCAGHGSIVYHVDCDKPVAECSCINAALAVARTILGEVAE